MEPRRVLMGGRMGRKERQGPKGQRSGQIACRAEWRWGSCRSFVRASIRSCVQSRGRRRGRRGGKEIRARGYHGCTVQAGCRLLLLSMMAWHDKEQSNTNASWTDMESKGPTDSSFVRSRSLSRSLSPCAHATMQPDVHVARTRTHSFCFLPSLSLSVSLPSSRSLSLSFSLLFSLLSSSSSTFSFTLDCCLPSFPLPSLPLVLAPPLPLTFIPCMHASNPCSSHSPHSLALPPESSSCRS